MDRINKDLVHYRSLETQVRSVEKANSELSKNLDHLHNFAKGIRECSWELIQKFLSENYEFPEDGIEEPNEKTIQKDISSNEPYPSQNSYRGTIGINFGCPRRKLPDYDEKFWSPVILLGGIGFQIGILKVRSPIHNNHPMLQILFQTTSRTPDKLKLNFFATNHTTRKCHFEKAITKCDQSGCIFSVLWNQLLEKQKNWLDSEGNLIIYCTLE